MNKFLTYIAILLTFPGVASAQTLATSTVVVEDIVFKKYTTPITTPQTETTVSLGDAVTINLTSQFDPATPIDLFVIPFTTNGFPKAKVFIKTVFNEERGVLKKYRISINQDILTELRGATSMRIGYCLGGCIRTTARLIPGTVLLPSISTTTLPYTLQTF